MLVFFLARDFDERLFGLPVLLLEPVHHGGVLTLDEAIKAFTGKTAAKTRTSSRNLPQNFLLTNAMLLISDSVHLLASSVHVFCKVKEEKNRNKAL